MDLFSEYKDDHGTEKKNELLVVTKESNDGNEFILNIQYKENYTTNMEDIYLSKYNTNPNNKNGTKDNAIIKVYIDVYDNHDFDNNIVLISNIDQFEEQIPKHNEQEIDHDRNTHFDYEI